MAYIYANLGAAMDINVKGDDTNVNFKKQGVKTEPASGRLLILTQLGGAWKERIVDPSKERIIISEEISESFIPPNTLHNFKGSLVFQKCDDKWIILNTGKGGAKFSFNGEPKNHLMLTRGEKGVVFNENGLLFLLIYLNNEGHVKKHVHEGKPQGGEFSLQKEAVVYSFDRENLCLIGKSPYCDWNISVEEDFAAGICKRHREMVIMSLNNKIPVIVNGSPVVEPRVLLRNSTIGIGNNILVYDSADADDVIEHKLDSGINTYGAERLVLIPASRNSDGSRKSLIYLPAPGKSVFVGRDATLSHIVISSKTVSKKHAQIICYDNMIMLLDCYSTNGTYVNGEKIAKRTVRPGDIIEFGEEKYILSYV